MRLIMQYQDSDDCTYSCTVTLPFIYESAEAALEDFSTVLNATVKAWNDYRNDNSVGFTVPKCDGYFTFAGHEFTIGDFISNGGKSVYLPEIYTIDEYFKDVENV